MHPNGDIHPRTINVLLYDIAYDIICVLLEHLRMGKKEKLDIKIETIPIRSDISFQELENYLSNHGFTAKKENRYQSCTICKAWAYSHNNTLQKSCFGGICQTGS